MEISDIVNKLLEVGKKEYGLNVNDNNRDDFVEFLKEQAEIYSENLPEEINSGKRLDPCVSYIIDKTLMYAYLIRQREVRIRRENLESTLIDNDEKLPLLRAKGAISGLWEDFSLYSLYGRRKRRGFKDYKFKRYAKLIDEIGKHPKVVKIWGRKLTYFGDISRRRNNKNS